MPYQPTEKTRQNSVRKRARLLAAASSIVAGRGFSGATITAIATIGGTSVGTVYSYFANRDALLVEVFRQGAAHELALVRAAVAAETDVAARLDALVRTFARRALNGRTQAWALLFEPVSPAVEDQRLVFRQAYVTLMEDIVREGVASGRLVPQDPAVSASALIGAISEALVGRLNPAGGGPLTATMPADDVVIDEIRALCFRAIGYRHLPATPASN